MKEYLKSTYYIDKDSENVKQFAATTTSGLTNDKDRAIKLYYATRDRILYNPFKWSIEKSNFRASHVLNQMEGFCVQKSIVLTAAARSLSIPARLGFAIVKNHLATETMLQLMKTDIFVFHGYTELFLNEKWVKATPVFNRTLCEKHGIKTLEFNGEDDSIFHPFDNAGKQHMEYLKDYGTFADMPLELMIDECKKYYPHWFDGSMPEIEKFIT